MKGRLKLLLSNYPVIYRFASAISNLIRSLKSVRIDIHDLREFAICMTGGQDLSRNNLRFFRNFLSHQVTGKGKKWLVLDVGAHDAWFVKVLQRFCRPTDLTITSYEPLPAMRSQLLEVGGRWPEYKLVSKAVGEAPGRAQINQYSTTGLSSLRDLSAGYSYAEGYGVDLVDKIEVEVVTLDAEMASTGDVPIILKIDTQGFEKQVLKGCERTLLSGRVKFVIVELMTVEKYSGAALYGEIFKYMEEFGFGLYDLNCIYYEAETGQVTEFDAIFELKSSSSIADRHVSLGQGVASVTG